MNDQNEDNDDTFLFNPLFGMEKIAACPLPDVGQAASLIALILQDSPFEYKEADTTEPVNAYGKLVDLIAWPFDAPPPVPTIIAVYEFQGKNFSLLTDITQDLLPGKHYQVTYSPLPVGESFEARAFHHAATNNEFSICGIQRSCVEGRPRPTLLASVPHHQ